MSGSDGGEDEDGSLLGYTVGYATTNECYNEQFLSIKSGCYNENRCYNERGGP
jgi:hypothetical protein